MDIYTKYVVTCEKLNPTLVERLLRKTREKVGIRAPCVINGFRDKINTSVFKIISIDATDEQMEFYGKTGRPILESEIKVVRL